MTIEWIGFHTFVEGLEPFDLSSAPRGGWLLRGSPGGGHRPDSEGLPGPGDEKGSDSRCG